MRPGSPGLRLRDGAGLAIDRARTAEEQLGVCAGASPHDAGTPSGSGVVFGGATMMKPLIQNNPHNLRKFSEFSWMIKALSLRGIYET